MKETLQFQWAEQAFEVRIRHSRRARHFSLRVLGPGLVEAVVPPGASARRIPDIVAHHRRWLSRTLARIERERGGISPLVPPRTIELQSIDRRWQVAYRAGTGCGGYREPGAGRLEVRHPEGRTAWRDPLNRWLAETARRHLVPWLDRVSETLALPYERVAIRGQKTRWGSCSARRNINLNYRLLFLPPPLVEYLFAHELCHTRHLNHSPAFWALVEKKVPGYRELDREMRKAGRHVPSWALPG